MSLLFYNLFLLLYNISIRFVSPWNKKARLWIRGRKSFPAGKFGTKTIWMHCASLGEFEQGRPLLEAVRQQYPDHKIVLSFFSPSGYEVRKNYHAADLVFYLPMDSQANARRLIDTLNPSLVLWVKYEFWYYYLVELKRRNIPVLLVSGIFRKDQPFFKWYGSIWREMLTSFSHLFIQNKVSIDLLHSIGIKDKVEIAGDTRFDRVIAIAEKKEPVPHIDAFTGGKPLLVAGSTWDEDEIELVHFVRSRPDIKFIIAPHEVTNHNLQEVKKQFPDSVFYSSLAQQSAGLNAHVLIIDNVGMLSKLYKYATVCFVGGGFGDDGVHNVLEAAVYGKPVVFGPVYEKFEEARGLVDCNGAFSVENALELEAILEKLFKDTAFMRDSGEAARKFVHSHQGATNKILDYIQRNRLLIS